MPKSTLYNWYRTYLYNGKEGLTAKRSTRQQWHTIIKEQKQVIVELAVKLPDEQWIVIAEVKRLAHLKAQGWISTPVPLLMSASKEFKDKSLFVHERWQTDYLVQGGVLGLVLSLDHPRGCSSALPVHLGSAVPGMPCRRLN